MNLRETPRRTRLAASGLLLFTLATGIIIGGVAIRVLSTRTAVAAAPAAQPKSKDGAERTKRSRGFIIDQKLLDEIGVTSEQRASIDAILDLREQEAKRMWDEWATRFDSAVDQTRGQVLAQLSEEQVNKLKKAIAERRLRKQQQKNEAGKSSRDSTHKPGHSDSNRDLFE